MAHLQQQQNSNPQQLQQHNLSKAFSLFQKLETATAEEKIMVFDEITPQALSLMTDVFG
ncbi:hypothetical protein GBA52_017320 [Prunus armeniaca]|nr:hypothetical protein GBA52_017320 [Prunus armeniaca]